MRKEKIDIPFPEKGSLVLRTDILFSLFLMSGIYAFFRKILQAGSRALIGQMIVKKCHKNEN